MIEWISVNKKSIDSFLRYLLSYLLSFVTVAVGFLNLIVARDLILVTLAFTPLNHWATGAIDKFAILLLGLTLLVFLILSEEYYRKGVPLGRLWERFSLVTAFQLFFLGFVHIIIPLAAKPTGLGLVDFLLAGGEAGIGYLLLMFALYSRKRNHPEKNKV